ncbi:hypothetical protein CYMTET_28748 [Cymbomonas tetramitiformis]|uniref:Uncharacterized protein n=1 Tax=Cymbomonas tetramitiformis TaxID=36881 RepID=A0AAE0FMM5_9CHLO|nr:hypothetical protein CYMTET_28748 [Cymbomonas tetramitiformis]
MELSNAAEISASEAIHLDVNQAEGLVCIRGKVALPAGKSRFAPILRSSQNPAEKGVVLEETEKYVYQEIMSPLRRLSSCNILDALPQPTIYFWCTPPLLDSAAIHFSLLSILLWHSFLDALPRTIIHFWCTPSP